MNPGTKVKFAGERRRYTVRPTAEVERCEESGPPPRRHYTEHGRWFWLYVIVGAALLLLTLLMCVPSRFGPVGW